MKTKPATVTQAMITRALKAAGDAGLTIARFEIDPTRSTLTLFTADYVSDDPGVRAWDEATR